VGGLGIFYVTNAIFNLYFYNPDMTLNTMIPIGTTPLVNIFENFVLVVF